ncbi:Thioredoxin C-2 [Planctomycetes bacterium Pan216]|uniref:Thioredoxin C-2 n=1 Tax=Kolteria novifilia TaxID=2527975 RepID=A0A518B5J6_9BACT|nr:Thioredoxin C-2 [Planctomycetes bacterium Pan216]
MPFSPWIDDVTEETFVEEVLARSRDVPVVLELWAAWCAPCKVLSPRLEEFANEGKGAFLLRKLDLQANSKVAQKFNVKGVPAVIAFVNGLAVDQFMGLPPEDQMRRFIGRLIPTEAETLLSQAVALEPEDPRQAAELYEKVVALDPTLTAARAALAECYVTWGELERAEEHAAAIPFGNKGYHRAQNVQTRIEFRREATAIGSEHECRKRCEANPDDLEARRDLGFVQAGKEEWEKALETFISIAETDREFGKARVKEPAYRILSIVGSTITTANDYRNRLSEAFR